MTQFAKYFVTSAQFARSREILAKNMKSTIPLVFATSIHIQQISFSLLFVLCRYSMFSQPLFSPASFYYSNPKKYTYFSVVYLWCSDTKESVSRSIKEVKNISPHAHYFFFFIMFWNFRCFCRLLRVMSTCSTKKTRLFIEWITRPSVKCVDELSTSLLTIDVPSTWAEPE